jgi:cytochrome c oxidase subunit 3
MEDHGLRPDVADEDHGHDPHLAHHFETPMQQYESGKLGMWIFLVTEVLLFGGLFCAYAVYRANHPEVFIYAHQYLDKWLGGLNTVVLICSSLTMAWAVRAAQTGNRKALVGLLTATFLFACVFLGVKYVEYRHKWKHGLLWGKHYRPQTGAHHEPGAGSDGEEAPAAGEDGAPAADPDAGGTDPSESEEGGHGEEPPKVHIFFGIYFVMTGLHGLHVLAGMAVILWLILRARKDHFSPTYFAPVDLGGLYWHLVDIIWIFLFPLLYLIG